MLIAEQLRLVGVPTFPCGVRWDDIKQKWAKWPLTPKSESWQLTALRPFRDPQLDWSSGVCGVPIPAGVVVFDLDRYKGATREAIEQHLGVALPWDQALIQNTISGGEHYAFAVDWPVRQGDSIDDVFGFDTRVAGKGFICTGKGYTQVGFGVLALSCPDGLPRLPNACRYTLEVVKTERNPVDLPDDEKAREDVNQIIAALRHLDPGCSRSEWRNIGFALRHHFHADEDLGFDIFDRWSSGEYWTDGTPPNYVPEHMEHQWGSFKPEGQAVTITIATLFYRAMKGGWIPPATFNAAEAFGSNAAGSGDFIAMSDRILETGGNPSETQGIITDIRGAGFNSLQVALLAAELKNALKDAGIKDAQVNKMIDDMLAPQGLPRVHNGYIPEAGDVLDANTAMHPTLWAPMHTKGKDLAPKGTHLNFEIMLQNYGIKVTFNEIAKTVHINGPGVPGKGVLLEEAALSYLESLANLNGYPTATCKGMLMLVANNNTFNPVSRWVNSARWDGRDHVGELFDQVELEPHEDREFCELLFRKWMRGAYAIGTGRLGSWEHCIVFVDPLGGAGKTRFFATLCPPELFKKGVVLDVSNKDSVKIAISHWICELGELDGTFSRSDQNKLKAFMSMDFDDLRLPYGRAYLKYPRRTAFVASVNEPHFFLDQSNNRRFWPMEVKHVNHLHDVDVLQAWAQVACEVDDRIPAHLTPAETQVLFARNEAFRTSSGVVDRLSSISLSTHRDTDKHMTVSEILALAGMSNPSKSDLNEAARWIRKCGFREHKRTGKWGFTVTVSAPSPTAGAFKPTIVKT